MKRRSVVFAAQRCVEVREETIAEPGAGQVRVQTVTSAISSGTEMLVYRGEFPRDLPLDETIGALGGTFAYPLAYGYAAVGRVAALGEGVPADFEGRLVFAFSPHQSTFNADAASLITVPHDIPPEQAVFLPNMETAISLVLDGTPLLGERVVVFGQGIVGLLTASLLARFPLASLVTLDRFALRRETSLSVGVHAALDPATPGALDALNDLLRGERGPEGADLTYELSGSPAALDQAITVTGYSGRVVIGSWYGEKRVDLALGGRFHRSRMRLIASQVSSIAPELRGRWTAERRFATAWEMLRVIHPDRFITHRFEVEYAADAYRLLDEHPAEALQVLLTYS